jgi:hypothetical protein
MGIRVPIGKKVVRLDPVSSFFVCRDFQYHAKFREFLLTSEKLVRFSSPGTGTQIQRKLSLIEPVSTATSPYLGLLMMGSST